MTPRNASVTENKTVIGAISLLARGNAFFLSMLNAIFHVLAVSDKAREVITEESALQAGISSSKVGFMIEKIKHRVLAAVTGYNYTSTELDQFCTELCQFVAKQDKEEYENLGILKYDPMILQPDVFYNKVVDANGNVTSINERVEVVVRFNATHRLIIRRFAHERDQQTDENGVLYYRNPFGWTLTFIPNEYSEAQQAAYQGNIPEVVSLG